VKHAFPLKLLVVLIAVGLVLGACSGAAAPAGAPAGEAAAPVESASSGADVEAAAEATAIEEVPAAAEASTGSDTEAPQVSPADQAPEATPSAGKSSATRGSDAASNAGGQRVFAIVPGQTVAQYAVEEEFFGQAVPFVTAVGKTDAVEGSVTLNFGEGGVKIANNTFTVDISTLTSDSGRRDRAIRERWLESSKYPLATFVGTGIENLPADADFGKDVSFQVAGDMTIRDVTQPLAWDMTVNLDGETLSGNASTFLYMRDFGFDPPDIAGILRVTDGVTVTVQFTAQEVK
jgi:polyisoprenoid-binding protein YceI